MWVSTTEKGFRYSQAVSKGFWVCSYVYAVRLCMQTSTPATVLALVMLSSMELIVRCAPSCTVPSIIQHLKGETLRTNCRPSVTRVRLCHLHQHHGHCTTCEHQSLWQQPYVCGLVVSPNLYSPTPGMLNLFRHTTPSPLNNFLLLLSVGLQKLFQYIGGENDAKQKIAMTAPVRVSVSPGAGPFCEDNFSISFFVPYEFQVLSFARRPIHHLCSRPVVHML